MYFIIVSQDVVGIINLDEVVSINKVNKTLYIVYI